MDQHHKLPNTGHRVLVTIAETARSFGASMLAGVVLTGQALED